jgi:hypothetical protein
MNPIVIVLAILLLIGIIPDRYSQKADEKTTLKVEMQKIPEKETVESKDDDYFDDDFSGYSHVIDIISL